MSKMELTAWLLPIFEKLKPEISTMVYLEDQDCVMVFYRNGGIRRVPTPGEGLMFMAQLVAGLED